MLAIFSSILCASTLQAGKIGDFSGTADWLAQVERFVSLEDPSVRYALAGSVLLGIACGLLGSFIVVRKLSLLGDTLSHAVLPGVAAAFLWTHTKSPIAIFIGACAAGVLGVACVGAITKSTHLKKDTAQGMVLAGFYGVGICLLTYIQNLPHGNKSGLDKFLFGQASAISSTDIYLMGSLCLCAILVITFFYKELLVSSFDPSYARVAGIPSSFFQKILILLLAFSVTTALQAVGVVLVSAMLIIPPATALLLAKRLHIVLILACIIGILSGAAGCFASFLQNNLPTGPFIVVAAATCFLFAFIFSPSKGLIARLRH